MTATEQAVAQRSLRAELRELVQSILDTEDTTTNEMLIRLAHKRFDGDEWAIEAMIREGLNLLIPTIAGEIRHQRRTDARLAEAGNTTARIARIFEHVGGGVSKRLLSCTRPEHRFIAEQRRSSAAVDLRTAAMHDAIADLHKDDTTPTSMLNQEEVRSIFDQYMTG